MALYSILFCWYLYMYIMLPDSSSKRKHILSGVILLSFCVPYLVCLFLLPYWWKFLLRDDASDSMAKMEAAEKALEEKQKVIMSL